LWIKGLRDCMQVAKEMPQTKIICVMDREADIFEVFYEHANSRIGWPGSLRLTAPG
jgi:hypothetical protein